MSQRSGRRGPALPYEILAGVAPTPRGWVVAAAKLVGVSLYPEQPELVTRFGDVVDHIPSYAVVAVCAPIGLHDDWAPGGRTCDREARRLLGWPRLGAIASAPARKDLLADDLAHGNVVMRRQAARLAELDEEMEPHRQRSVYAVHPELSFFQLNGDQPVTGSRRTSAGRAERAALLAGRVQGIERVLGDESGIATANQLLDAGVALWTARRIAARAASRLPLDPEWDSSGLRMEWVR